MALPLHEPGDEPLRRTESFLHRFRALAAALGMLLWPVVLLVIVQAAPGPVVPPAYQAPGTTLPVAQPATDVDSPTRSGQAGPKVFWAPPVKYRMIIPAPAPDKAPAEAPTDPHHDDKAASKQHP